MNKLIYVFLQFFISNFIFAQNNSENIKTEAKATFYKIVNIYNSGNCDSLTSYLNDSIIIINSPKDTILKTSSVINFDKYCERVFSRVNKNITDSIHKKYYKLQLISADEFSNYKDKKNLSFDGESMVSADINFCLYFLAHKSHRFHKNDVFISGIEPLKMEDFYTKTDDGWENKENNEFSLIFSKLYFFVLRKTDNGWKIIAIPN